MSAIHATSPDDSNWSSTDHSASGARSNGSPLENKSPPLPNMGFIRGFPAMQKKVTRDGQPAKRRGPKPDSKPAQTRRQELNRQAQRTHRERKEHYIKALETEITRLRETFIAESEIVQRQIRQQELILQDQQRENIALKEMLVARGIHFEGELQTRKASVVLHQPNQRGISPNFSMPSTSPYAGVVPGPPSTIGYNSGHEQPVYSNGRGSLPGHSPGIKQNSNSPEVLDHFIKQEDSPIADMPGIFEKDPQLGVDFILALEATCREHGEYLIRRSITSPNDPDTAMFSGHALMASCPPPSHLEKTPAINGGLGSTWPHQMPPDASLQTLTILLNLSQKIKSAGYVEGGQVTPVMALQSLRGHRNYHTLTRDDVVGMIDTIRNKVRCYGFGAVMEDFELRDALSTIFATKPEIYAEFGNEMTDDIDDIIHDEM